MAAIAPIPEDRTVYRGLRNSNWCRLGVVHFKAFLLRPGNALYPPEAELSLGLTAGSAVDELTEHHGTAALSVLAVNALPHHLQVIPDPDNAAKAQMSGLPMFSTEEAQRGLAITMASDLAAIAWHVPVPQVN
jgi:hypothetical protein